MQEGRIRQADVARDVEAVEWIPCFTEQTWAKMNDVLGATVFLGEPFEVEPLVSFVRHDDSAERRVAANECGKEAVHAGGFTRAGVAGEKEMPVCFVARPTKTGEREDDLPTVRDDLPGWITDPPAMIGIVEEKRGERANDAACREVIGRRQTPCAENPGGRDGQRERQRERRAQPGLIMAEIPMDKPTRESKENGCNNECDDRDGVRILQPLADQNIRCRESFHVFRCGQ